MNITVKNVKIAEFASEETLCFQATVYVDGKRAFTAHNDGHGGSNYYYPLKGGTRDAIKSVEKYAAALPKIETTLPSFNTDGSDDCFSYQPDIDHLVNEAVEDFQIQKDVKRLLKKVAIFDDGEIYTFNIAGRDAPRVRNQIEERHPKCIILNLEPLDEAVKLYKSAM
tara:strand:- start:1324 stop:1827 length:504 start_codon:yes stop_codon:yes gene_type:complete